MFVILKNHYLIFILEKIIKNIEMSVKNVLTLKLKIVQIEKKKEKNLYLKNKEREIEYASNWSKNHKERVSENRRKNYNHKYHNDINFKLRDSIPRVIRQALKFDKQGRSIFNFLPYNVEQLRQHLESLFEFWMNWDNWKKYNPKTWDDNDPDTWTWNIDHIIPKSFFSYTSVEDEQFKKCWSLENLRPYSAKRNVLEANRRDVSLYIDLDNNKELDRNIDAM